MERLTMKNSDGTYSQPTHLTFEKMFYKLAEFEDFMEEICCEDLEELKELLMANAELVKSVSSLDANYICKCLLEYPTFQKENQALKDRWQKLKDDLMLYYTVGSTSGAYGYDVYKTIFNKMQELENGGNNEKNN